MWPGQRVGGQEGTESDRSEEGYRCGWEAVEEEDEVITAAMVRIV